MKTKLTYLKGTIGAAVLIFIVATSMSHERRKSNRGYEQVNLVSDISTNARHTDPELVNAWGILAGPESVWANVTESGLTKAYGRNGSVHRYAIRIPSPGSDEPGHPTGLVQNDTDEFVLTNGKRRDPAVFLMATEDGTITAWNHSITKTDAVIVVDRSSSEAVYKGLAIARDTNGAARLYATDFHGGVVDVFDGQFQYLSSFTDSNVPPLFAPFNVQNIRGNLFVTFAKQELPEMEDDEPGPGNGLIDIFAPDGTLLRRFATGDVLNSPWGLAVAPRNFGEFSRALLVGNFGDGRINAYDLLTGKLLGHLTQPSGEDIAIEGLWGLDFDQKERSNRECDFDADRLYFAAGPGDEEHGLIGFIRTAEHDRDHDNDRGHD